MNLNLDTGVREKLEPDLDLKLQPPAHKFPTFVGDILERDPASSLPPGAPSPKLTQNGFPAHRKRVPRVSRFKQQQTTTQVGQVADAATVPQDAPKPWRAGFDADAERKAIDAENKRMLAGMSEEEIEQQRQDLMTSLSPDLLQKLLMRSNLNDGSNEQDIHFEHTSTRPSSAMEKRDADSATQPSMPQVPTDLTSLRTKQGLAVAPQSEQEAPSQPVDVDASSTASRQPPSNAMMLPTDTNETTSNTGILPTDTREPTSNSMIHFPSPIQPPDLDPDDPSFLKNLHDKYFPSLPYNPSQLSWMSPIDPSDTSSPYHPSQTTLNASQLRFDFKGALLAPSIARAIPSDMGLHHHAEAPEAAGYTIPELAVLARSKVAAQRCMAYQTLGRILYRLGQGEFGTEKARQDTNGPVQVIVDPDAEEDAEENDNDVGSAMAAGLRACMEEGRVVETLTEEANRTKGHLTARTFAQEALWNWRRGGGRTRHAI